MPKDKDLGVEILAKLDEIKTIFIIDEQLKKIEKDLRHLLVQAEIQVDKGQLDQVIKNMEQIQKVSQNIVGTEQAQTKELKQQEVRLKEIIKLGKQKQRIQTFRVAGDRDIRTETRIFDPESKKFETTKIVKDFEAYQKQMEKLVKVDEKAQAQMRAALLKTEQRRRQELEKSTQAQAKAINRAWEMDQKAQQQIRAAILKTEQRRRQEIEKSEQAQAKAINRAIEQEQERLRSMGTVVPGVQAGELFNLQNLEQQDRAMKQIARSIHGANAKLEETKPISAGTGKEVLQLSGHVLTADGNFKKFTVSADKATGAIRQQETAIKGAVNKHADLMGQLKVAMQRVPLWFLAMTAFWGTLRAIQRGITSVVEVDTALTELRKVTDETKESYKEFTVIAGELGTALGRTTVEVIKSTAEFARLGFGMKKSTVLAKEALLLASVGDMEAVESSKALISTIKGFGIEVDEQGKNVRKVVDMYNNVGNNYAISAAGIASALQRSAASLNVAGNSIEESIALITAANSVIQDPEITGTAFKTVAMRIRGISEEGEELSDLVPTLEKSFNRLGFSLMKGNGVLRSTFEVMQDLAGVWHNLDDLAKADILEKVAGRICPLVA